jgi:glycosyltransferase involved in cell wall biosynthesis
MISVVVPIHNQEPSVLRLYDRLSAVLERLRKPYEILFIDDASTDLSFDLLSNLVETDSRLKVMRLRRRFGVEAAVSAGFDEAQGDILIAIEDPASDADDLPMLLQKLEEGHDIAIGWRTRRNGYPVRQTAGGWLMSRLSGLNLHDYTSSIRAYRADALKDVALQGELQRFVPALVSRYGARVAEVPVRSHAARNGPGLRKTLEFICDVVAVRFLLDSFSRPMRTFGPAGFLCFAMGVAMILAFALLPPLPKQSLWTVSAGALLIGGIVLFATGLLGETLMRSYFETPGRRVYSVRDVRSRKDPQVADGQR